MSSVTRTAGVNGTFAHRLNVVPFAAPRMTIYSDSARTIVAVAEATLAATANPSVFTASYPASLVPATYYLGFLIEVTEGEPDFADNDDTLVLVPISSTVDGLPLCSLAEYEVWLGETVADGPQAELLLAIASTAVRTYLDQTVSEATTLELLDGGGRPTLMLGERPVTAISTVLLVDGATETALVQGNDKDYVWYSDGRVVRIGWAWEWGRQNVSVSYTHGYPTTPEDICGVIFGSVRRTLDNPSGAESEEVWSHAVKYGSSSAQARVGFTRDERMILDRYRVPLVG